jgi:hypothetical protein
MTSAAPMIRKGDEKVCQVCGKTFLIHNNFKQKTCSRACGMALVRSRSTYLVTKKCEVCGREFESSRSLGRRYCDRECMGVAVRRREPIPVMDRIMENIVTNPTTACWIWTLQLTVGKKSVGYAKFKLAGKHTLGHIAAYEATFGPVPEGCELDHKCRNRACVNPHHLEPVTHRENIMRSPISPCAINARKTHCIHGHKFSIENTYTATRWKNGIAVSFARMCRTCRNARHRNKKRRVAKFL